MTIAPTTSCTPDQVRQGEIARYGVLEQPPGPDLQALVDLAAQVCRVPTAAINLITGDHAHAIATAGLDPYLCAREDSMCTPVLDDPATVVVTDARGDRRYDRNPMVTGVLANVRFYASVPLTTDTGSIIGRLCAFDDAPRTLDNQQRTALQTLADRVVDVLDLRLRNKQLEDSLSALGLTRDELRRSNEQLAVFARQVSHDLRTPLTGILVNVESLLAEPLVGQDPDLASLAACAYRSGERMAKLIDDFLEQATYGATVLKADTDLAEVVDSVVDDLAPALRRSRGKVSVGELPVVCADPVQLYSVVLNLLSNAVKFTRPGVPPRIYVQAETLPDRWRVSIADNGSGIPERQHRRVFELFARLERSVPGNGIGLPTAARIIDAHGGRIGISRGRKVGTEVWFELPR